MKACDGVSFRRRLALLALILTFGWLIWPAIASEHNPSPTEASHPSSTVQGEAQSHESQSQEESFDLGKILPLWTVIPFIGILLSIALFPLFAPTFWHHHYPKVSAFWALVFAIPFLIAYRGHAFHEILEIYLIDYIPFIILLWGLFTVAGGILLRGSLRGTPPINTLMLLIGTVLASWMGTTGASMLLIRPMIRANAYRKVKMHVVIFFIFLVSNIGGSLTPLGDPPLFLGFLHSVPFFWTFKLLPHMLFVSGVLLTLFFLIDTAMLKREKLTRAPDDGVKEPIRVDGLHNLVFLAGIIGAVLMSGIARLGEVQVLGVTMEVQNILRDLIIVLMGYLSLKTTPYQGEIRRANAFTWFPIQEVAYLFAGIFMTIVPALAILRAGSEGAMAFLINLTKTPPYYFWITGGLSSFLDNAPTYLTFFNTALGQHFSEVLALKGEAAAVKLLISQQPLFLEAISAGAVFMGANTYIGNAPNFMVRSIAEENNIKMPSFFGYMVWSIGILIPLYILVTLIFF